MKNDVNNKPEEKNTNPAMALDDEQRIKVLSPGMLVFKRFVRNKLAITGSIFIGLMFLFAFVGGWVISYEEDQTFKKYVDMSKDFAGVSENTAYKFIIEEGKSFSLVEQSQFIQTANKGETVFTTQGNTFTVEQLADELYLVSSSEEVAISTVLAGNTNVSLSDKTLGEDFKTDFLTAIEEGMATFEYEGNDYVVIQEKKRYVAGRLSSLAYATMNVFDYAIAGIENDFDFCLQSELAVVAIENGMETNPTFNIEGTEYQVALEDEKVVVYQVKGSETIEYANISRFLIQPIYDDVFFSLDYKAKVKDYIAEGIEEFTYVNEDGTQQNYTIVRQNLLWTIKWIENTQVLDTFAAPSGTHWVGTDGNGMDVLTRLMFGGRISLMIGFIVVIISTFIGVVLGGLAGYFGKFVDNLIMRIVDIFNSIPSLPLVIILGAMMDQLRVDPQQRMIILMIILGVLGWPPIARMVRGQILSLREQEFMIAAEATGISVSKRIFKHLVPNVMPQLIVISTLGLGGVILTESVLSFLGVGVKFPFASWGNIINAVSNVHVMTNYLFVWIPAGLCILITVLGFNFIGDGLRDAFDPKMKR